MPTHLSTPPHLHTCTCTHTHTQVIVTDGGSLTDSTIVYLKIVDINDNEPVFEPAVYSASICENVGSDVLLFNFRVSYKLLIVLLVL